MFLVSSVELVVTACRSGVIGAFPTLNCRSPEELDRWCSEIRTRLGSSGNRVAPYCPNLVVHNSYRRMNDDLAVIVNHRPDLVITSVGSPAPAIEALHAADIFVLSDVATIGQARKAVAAGADGLVLLCAGAGGQTGWINPFSFARAVRAFFAGPIVLAGGIADGRSLAAARMLGCDLGYMGTRFIATTESAAPDAYKAMLVASSADDVMLTSSITGLPANFLRQSLINAGFDPDDMPSRGPLDVAEDIGLDALERKPKRWKDIWSAGHSTSGIEAVVPVRELVARIKAEYEDALEAFHA